MTDMKYILYSLLVGMMMVSCSSADDIADDANSQQAAQQVDLLVSVGSKTSQSNKQSVSALRRAATFQEMEGLVAIPFHTDGAAVAPTDHPYLDMVRTTEDDSRVEGHNNYYVDHCYLMPGTDRMLVYGKSKPSPSADQTVNGVLSALPTVRTKLEDIRFSLSSIRNTTEADDEATALADYMTRIADSEGWSTTTDPTLKSYYQDFIHSNAEGGGLMSGSAAHIKAFVAALRAQLASRTDAVSMAIKANIDNNTSIASNTYPRSIGLPDGAAAIRWYAPTGQPLTTSTVSPVIPILQHWCSLQIAPYAPQQQRCRKSPTRIPPCYGVLSWKHTTPVLQPSAQIPRPSPWSTPCSSVSLTCD